MIVTAKRKDGSLKQVDINNIISFASEGKKIALIKEYRDITGLGLKDSKDAVEKFGRGTDALGTMKFDVDPLVEEFKRICGVLPEPLTKEEFMNIIESAIDSMDSMYFTDMLETVEVLIENIKKKGGLEEIAKERQEFLVSL